MTRRTIPAPLSPLSGRPGRVLHPAPGLAAALVFLSLGAAPAIAQGIAQGTAQTAAQAVESPPELTPPREVLGFEIGDDYHLATYTQFVDYWKTLAAESPRMTLEEIGTTAEGRTQYMAILTSRENHADLAHYREIARRLALADDLDEEEARALAAEGKAVVWIDGGLHATEVLGAHQLMELVWQLASRDDPETLRILDDVIVLAVHANPDGQELVSDWYMREEDPEERSTRRIPRLYHKYIGHDNNRDFYMVTQPETENMTRIMFREWFPQIVYNHHQTGPRGTVMFAPPFRDPFNYNIDPLVMMGIEMVGSAMHSRFVAEGKPGTTMRGGAGYSTWWNGGLRTVTYFHNMIGLLTETIGHPTPMEIPFILDRQLPGNDLPAPIAPQPWHFRQSIDYSMTANRAVLDYASRYRETLLYRIYRMGRRSIERGSRDHWTRRPERLRAVEDALDERPDARQREDVPWWRAPGLPVELFDEVFRDPAARDPRGYILTADQPDFPTVTKFVNTLIKNGVAVERATAEFEVGGIRYPAGSYVVKTAQAFRPHVIDMFEPQDHPNDFEYEGGPPIPPYDNAGWTLAFQMGVEFDRVLEGFEGPFERIEGLAKVPEGAVTRPDGAAGFLLDHQANDAFVATNRLLADGAEVYWLSEELTVDGRSWPAGTIYIPAGPGPEALEDRLASLAAELGLRFVGVASRPSVGAMRMRPVRIGLWDRYGGSMASGWTRWILEQFEFPYELVFPPALDAGGLRQRYDVLVFPSGAIPPPRPEGAEERGDDEPDYEGIPEEYHDRLGRITQDSTIPRLEEFLRAGGTIITIGGSTAMAYHAELPITNYLVDFKGDPLPREEYYMPGSVHRVRVDNSLPVAWGVDEQVDVFFNRSPVFGLPDEADGRSSEAGAAGTEGDAVRRVAWFDTNRPLRSGWAWGQHYLTGGVTIAEADVGAGKLYLFGPEILNRGQPHGTFKFLFNGIYLAGATAVEATAAAGEEE